MKKRNPIYNPKAGDIFYSPVKPSQSSRAREGFFVVDYKDSFCTAVTRETGIRESQAYVDGFSRALIRENAVHVVHGLFNLGSGVNEHGFTADTSVRITGDESIKWMKQRLIQKAFDDGWDDSIEGCPENEIGFGWLAEVLVLSASERDPRTLVEIFGAK